MDSALIPRWLMDAVIFTTPNLVQNLISITLVPAFPAIIVSVLDEGRGIGMGVVEFQLCFSLLF